MKPCAGTRGCPATLAIVGNMAPPSSGQCPLGVSADAPDAALPPQDLAETTAAAVAAVGVDEPAAAVADAPRQGASASRPAR